MLNPRLTDLIQTWLNEHPLGQIIEFSQPHPINFYAWLIVKRDINIPIEHGPPVYHPYQARLVASISNMPPVYHGDFGAYALHADSPTFFSDIESSITQILIGKGIDVRSWA